MGSIVYFFSEAIRGLYQAKLMTFVSIISIGASLFFMSIVALGFVNLEGMLKRAGDQADIAVYLTDDVAQDSVTLQQIIATIRQKPQIREVTFLSKDSAWERFSDVYGSELLDAVSENPLPASLELFLAGQAHTGEAAKQLKQELELISGVENVRYSREWLDLIERFRRYFLTASLLFGGIMLLVLHSIIANTIKLTIYARRELVRNMHLVGATEVFVNMPFLLEGMLQGFIGGVLCVIVLAAVRLSALRMGLLWGPDYFPLLILFAGVLFGWIGSYSAVRKFLA